MSKPHQLTMRQQAVIEDLFAGELDEQAVLNKHGVKRHVYERWLSDERFAACFERRVAQAYRSSRIILARYAPAAANRLVELTRCSKEETVRRACLDVISLQQPNPESGPPTPTPPTDPSTSSADPLSPETASRILAALADGGLPHAM